MSKINTVSTVQNQHANPFITSTSFTKSETVLSHYSHSFSGTSFYYKEKDKGCYPDCSSEDCVCNTESFNINTTVTRIVEYNISGGGSWTSRILAPCYSELLDMTYGECWNVGKYASGDIGQMIHYRDYFAAVYDNSAGVSNVVESSEFFNITSERLDNDRPKEYNYNATAHTGTRVSSKHHDWLLLLQQFNFAKSGNIVVSGADDDKYVVYNGNTSKVLDLPDGCRDFVIEGNMLYYVKGDDRIYWEPIKL
jgi:hypothetical protein